MCVLTEYVSYAILPQSISEQCFYIDCRPHFATKRQNVYVGGGKRYMNYKNFVSLKCGFTAVRVHVMFAVYYCHIRSGSIAWGTTNLSCRKSTHVCIRALSTPALHFRQQRNFKGWVEEDEHSFPASCGNQVDGASKINQAKTNLDSRKMTECIALYLEGLLKETRHWPIGLVVAPDTHKSWFSLVWHGREGEIGKKRMSQFQNKGIFVQQLSCLDKVVITKCLEKFWDSLISCSPADTLTCKVLMNSCFSSTKLLSILSHHLEFRFQTHCFCCDGLLWTKGHSSVT